MDVRKLLFTILQKQPGFGLKFIHFLTWSQVHFGPWFQHFFTCSSSDTWSSYCILSTSFLNLLQTACWFKIWQSHESPRGLIVVSTAHITLYIHYPTCAGQQPSVLFMLKQNFLMSFILEFIASVTVKQEISGFQRWFLFQITWQGYSYAIDISATRLRYRIKHLLVSAPFLP